MRIILEIASQMVYHILIFNVSMFLGETSRLLSEVIRGDNERDGVNTEDQCTDNLP